MAGLVVLLGANVAAAVLEPLPATSLPDPWFVVALNLISAAVTLAALGGLLVRRRWGMASSALAGGIGLVMVVACPVSGHHHFGLWWVGEIACVAAWTAVSLAGLRQAPSPHAS